MRSAERRTVNALEMKCLRSLVGVSRMERVRNEEVRRRAGIEMELASRADQRVLRWNGHVESQWGTGTRETEVRLDGWCEGGVRQQRNDGGGNAQKTGKRGEPWYICN